MALFRRNKNTEEVTGEVGMPQELQEYYQAENRERSWVAWVLGLTTLVVTVVLALGLFYGGRYVYRKIRSNDNKQTVSVNENNDKNDDKDRQDTPATEAPSTTPATTPAPSQATSSATTSTPQVAATQSANLPSTGAESTIAVFVAVTVLAYAAHRRFLTKS